MMWFIRIFGFLVLCQLFIAVPFSRRAFVSWVCYAQLRWTLRAVYLKPSQKRWMLIFAVKMIDDPVMFDTMREAGLEEYHAYRTHQRVRRRLGNRLLRAR